MDCNIERKHKVLDHLHCAMELDALSTRTLEYFCKVAYRMNITPLTAIRSWLKDNEIKAEAHYLKTKVWNAGTMDWLRNKVKNKVGPLLLVVVQKEEGFTKKVRIFYIPGFDGIKDSLYPRLKILK